MRFAARRSAATVDPDFTRNAAQRKSETRYDVTDMLLSFLTRFSYDVRMIRRPKHVMYKGQMRAVMNKC